MLIPKWLRALLGEAAWAAARTKGSYFSALFHRLARRRGVQRAIVAVGHSLLRTIYYILRDKTPYVDLGPDHFDKLDTARIERHHIHRLEQLGYTVSLSPKECGLTTPRTRIFGRTSARHVMWGIRPHFWPEMHAQ